MIALDVSLENLYRQYYHCRRNKRNTVNALRFEAEREKNLIALREALLDRSYQPRRSVCFFTTRPKLREILAANFRDRVVHHLLVDYLERIWEPVFIHDSYACRKGKGVHKGVARLQLFIRQVTANGARPAWYLQLDIRNYFMSIDRNILFGMLAAKLKDETALWLTRLLVYHDVTANCHFRGRRDYLLVRRRVVGHLKSKLARFETQLVSHARNATGYRFDPAMLDRLAAVLSSYRGHLALASTRRLWPSLWRRFDFLSRYFALDAADGKLVRLYRTPRHFSRVREQYRYFRWRFPDDVLFFQVGRFDGRWILLALSSLVVLTAAMGFAGTVPANAVEREAAAQSNSGFSVVSRSGCRHPDRTKCRRAVYRPAQETQPAEDKQPSAAPRREGTRRCLKGFQPHRSPRRC